MGRYDTDTEDTTEEEEYVPSSADADEPEEEAAPERSSAARRVVRGGWGNADANVASASPFPVKLKPDGEGVIVKFLEDQPYTSYKQHWINEITDGQKAFTCLEGIEDAGCPLCDGGDRPSSQFHFNVAEMSTLGVPVLKTYDVGPTVYDTLKTYHVDKRQGPLDKHYWLIKRTKSNNRWSSTFFMMKEEDLVDEGIEPITAAQISSMSLWTDSVVRIPSRKDLLEIAGTYLGLE